MKRCLFTSRCASHYENNVWDTMTKIYHIDSLMLNIHPNDGENQIICVKITFVCSKCKEMLILLYWPSDRTNPVTSHAVVQQDGGALAPKAITKQPFFFKMVTLIMFVIYFFNQSGNRFTK